ncbi:MAG: trypsin-like peptidase domain-containing protein [Thermoguttaceae bacterium]|nr:trypsin-like peptidase domain-containing protein [Thermoguttaceae bacterium]MDW8038285.1 trypsin-like peptidase domain-containing protein [Thermoguttaceae bacterium]
MVRWLAFWAAGLMVAAEVWAGPIPPPVAQPSAFPLAQLFAGPSARPHPAVVRVIVQERGGMSLGSGALVAVAGSYGLVVTNWHVVRDAAGPITVIFPDGFRSGATILKVDPEWDLAALAIWRPQADPIPLAAHMPRLGEPLTIVGYGNGQYRAATGRCLQYLSPSRHAPPEMIELSVAARQGDSGGPILNSEGQLAGVLFGASWGRTAGSSCTRVRSFLASLSPWFTPAEVPNATLAGSPSPTLPAGNDPATSPMTPHGLATQREAVALAGGMNPQATDSSSDLAWLPAAQAYPPASPDRFGSGLVPPWKPPDNGRAPSIQQPNSPQSGGLPSPASPNGLPPAAVPGLGGFSGRAPQVWAGSPSPDAGANSLLPISRGLLPASGSRQNPAGAWNTPWPDNPPSTTALPSTGISTGPSPSSNQNPSRFEAIKNFLAFVGAVALLLLAVRVVSAVSSE